MPTVSTHACTQRPNWREIMGPFSEEIAPDDSVSQFSVTPQRTQDSASVSVITHTPSQLGEHMPPFPEGILAIGRDIVIKNDNEYLDKIRPYCTNVPML